MQLSAFHLKAALISLSLASSHSYGQSSSNTVDIESLYNELYALDQSTFGLPEKNRIQAITAAYENNFRKLVHPDDLKSLPSTTIGYLFRSAEYAAIYSRDSKYLNDIRSIMAEMERRSIAGDYERKSFYRVMVGYREFESARHYHAEQRNLDIEPLPTVVTPPGTVDTGPRIYRVSNDRFELTFEHATISEGDVLIVVAHPLCAFSRFAMQMIESDQQLSSGLPDKVIWLAPVDTYLHFSPVQEWNKGHPATPVVLAHDRYEWPMIDTWATPSFYLLHDGQLVGQFSGWPKDGSHRGKLIELLEKGDLSVASP